ncbi:hypothetical protein T484DRAFT_1791865, partial [Baffinella frigidus]
MSGETGDFTGKQFSEQEVADKVKEQYGEAHARIFYKYVMGGGGLDIHYGIYRAPTDGVFESSKATNKKLLQSLDWMAPVTKDSLVLDLGSGHGGISHDLVSTFGCKVVGLNISPEQNGMNKDEAIKLGFGDRVE